MKLSFKRGQKGFTLVELMVVVGILAVLMTIVVPAVTGTKSTSIAGQVQSDAAAVQKAMDNFQNKGVSPLYPEEALGVAAQYQGTNAGYQLPSGTVLTKKDGSTITVGDSSIKSTAGGLYALGKTLLYGKTSGSETEADYVATYMEINWDKTTKVWQSDGTVNNAAFVPDFLVKRPSSVPLENDEGLDSATVGTKLAEFLWLVKVNNPGSQDASRTLEVYRLQDWTSGAATYKQIF